MPPEDRVRIRHMVEAAEAAEAFLVRRERADIESDRMLLFALVRAVEIVGEAATRVTDETKAATPAVPWSAIVGMRNRLIHAYFDIDRDILWRTVNEELPALIEQLRPLTAEN